MTISSLSPGELQSHTAHSSASSSRLKYVLIRTSSLVHSTKKIKYLEENVGAVHVQLTKEENDEIRKVVEAAEISGPRYPEMFADSLYAETPEA